VQFRANPGDIGNLYVRSDQNQMIPLSNLVKITPITGAQQLLTSTCSGQLNSTVRKLKAVALEIKTMERLAAEVLPPSMGYEWSGSPRRARVWRYCTDNLVWEFFVFGFGCPVRELR